MTRARAIEALLACGELGHLRSAECPGETLDSVARTVADSATTVEGWDHARVAIDPVGAIVAVRRLWRSLDDLAPDQPPEPEGFCLATETVGGRGRACVLTRDHEGLHSDGDVSWIDDTDAPTPVDPRDLVRATARRLDDAHLGWECLIDLARLDLLTPGCGLLELLDEIVDAGPLDLGAPADPIERLAWERELGLRPDEDEDPAAWAELTRAWIEAIAQRRSEYAGVWAGQLAALARRGVWLIEQREATPEPQWRPGPGPAETLDLGAGDGASIRPDPLSVGWRWEARWRGERAGPCVLPGYEAARVAAEAWLREHGAVPPGGAR